MSMTYYAVTDDPNELAHFGIKGMKWGVRRTDAQLGHPRHSGARRNRSAAYKKAQSKLGKMMKSGIKKAEAHWQQYNSPRAKEERFMKKAMEKARTGTLKYGKLTDDQVRRVTERLALERNARQLGNTENPSYMKRIRTSLANGIVEGVGRGATAYMEERWRGRGRTTAEIKSKKRMADYESQNSVQKQKAQNALAEEYYKTAYEEGGIPKYKSAANRAKYLAEVKARNKKNEYTASIQKVYDEQEARNRAINDAKLIDDNKRKYRSDETRKLGGNALKLLDDYNTAHERENFYGNNAYNVVRNYRSESANRVGGDALKRLNSWNEQHEHMNNYRAAQLEINNKSVPRVTGSTSSKQKQKPKRPGTAVPDWQLESRRSGESATDYARRVNDMRNTSNRRKRQTKNRPGWNRQGGR